MKNTFCCSVDEYHEHEDAFDGICISCGEWSTGGVEPDAEEYECECCGAKAVMGVGNALIGGVLDICCDDE